MSRLIKNPLLTGMRTVAVIEAVKGAIVLLAGLGLLALIQDREIADAPPAKRGKIHG